MALSSVDKAAALRRAELLSGLGADDLLQLAAVAEERSFERGEYLFYEGEDGDYLYLILEGRIRADRGGAEVYIAGPGETIGTFSILDREPRSASARAIEPASTLAIHRADLAQILADNYSLVEGLFIYLTRIIRRMNERQFPEGQQPRIPE
jgi:CRP/FNR family cyclic AMP-dependent transcriptional regulator